MVRDAPGIFHSSAGKLRYKHLVVLFEWILLAEEVLVENHSALSHVKHQLMIDLIDE